MKRLSAKQVVLAVFPSAYVQREGRFYSVWIPERETGNLELANGRSAVEAWKNAMECFRYCMRTK